MKFSIQNIVLLLVLQLSAKAQFFTHITERDGLCYNIVNCILKDSKGFLWIGTYNGFSRFDGANFHTIKIRKGNNSLQSEVIHSLCEDRFGNIWGGTDHGVFRYAPGKDSFSNYPIISLGKNSIFWEILCDKQGDIWAMGIWSLFKYDPIKNIFVEVVKTTTSLDSIDKYRTTKNGILENSNGKGFWITTNTGLLYYDKQIGQLICSKNRSSEIYNNHITSGLTPSKTGRIWYFDNKAKEAILFDPLTNSVSRRISLTSHLADNHIVATMFEDSHDRLWLCTWDYDMLYIELGSNHMERIEHKPNDPHSIASSFFWDVIEDENNTLWFGTLAGISKTNPEKEIFQSYGLSTSIPALKEGTITRVTENTEDGSIWFTTDNLLLIKYIPFTKLYKVFDLKKAIPSHENKMPAYVNSIQFYRHDTYVSTYNGTWVLKENSEVFKPNKLLPANYEDFRCSEMVFCGDTAIYYNNGREILFWDRFNNQTILITQPSDTGTSVNNTIVSKLKPDTNGRIWYSSAGDNLAMMAYQKLISGIKLGTAFKFGSGAITDIQIDKHGLVWVVYKSVGLFCYNPETKRLNFYNETNGLPGNRLHCVAFDKSNNTWVMYYNKVSVLLANSNSFLTFNIPYSESKYAYSNAMVELSGGNILASIRNELFEFFPDRMNDKPKLQKPLISQVITPVKSIAIFNDSVIRLNPTENTLRFQFGSLLSTAHFSYSIEYKLNGAEDNWTSSSSSHEALYNNLAPGKYTFMVRLKGKNAIWETKATELQIIIETPWYKSTLAWMVYVFSICLLIYLVYKYRINKQHQIHNLQTKAQQLEKDKALVMYENLKQQLNPHFLFNSLSSLNSLIGRDPSTAKQFLDNLSKTYRYILKSRDIETVPLSNEITFVQNYIQLQKTRFREGFNVEYAIPDEYLDAHIVPVTLQNLIENALKHNIADAESPLLIKIFVEDDYLIVSNNIQLKENVETSNKQGLLNFQSLYQFLSSKPVVITDKQTNFIIKIPLL